MSWIYNIELLHEYRSLNEGGKLYVQGGAIFWFGLFIFVTINFVLWIKK